jgi:adenylate cyclase
VADPNEVQRRLVAVFAADVEGYARLMGADEVGTLKSLTERRAILDKAIADHRGRIANTAGDSVLAEFGSAVDAVQCAVEAQVALAATNAELSPDRRINFRIGIHVGDVMVRAGDLFGDGVNIAARLQTLAQPGGVCVSGVTYDQVRKVLPIAFIDMGEQQVKNIEEPVRAFAVATTGQPAAERSAFIPDTSKSLPLPDKPSIAVLPFQNMSGDPEQDYFADGMVEEIITALSRFKSLFVIARNSSFIYKGRAIDVKQVGRELGVRYVLEGSVRKSGTRVRITGQLVEASTGNHLWADKFDGALEDVFELQDRVTSSVVGIVAPKIEQAELDRAQRSPTTNLRAYDHFLRGVSAYYLYTAAANAEAIEHFSRAVLLDPHFAEAYSWVANCYYQRPQLGSVVAIRREGAEAIKNARRSIELARDDAFILTIAALTLWAFSQEKDAAAALAQRAIELNPNLAYAWTANGWIRSTLGQQDIAIQHFHKALALGPMDPQNFTVFFGLAIAHFLAGRNAEAKACAEKALLDKPDHPAILMLLALAEVCLGHLDQGRAIASKSMKLRPSHRITWDLSLLQNEADRTRWVDACRLAGFPE